MTLMFVTGTSTDVGKTIVTAALAATATAAGRSVAVCKPAQTGVAEDEPGDLATITQLSGVTSTLELARYPEPLAPDTAARRCGAPLLTIDETLSAITELTADLVLVEGAGGVLVRIGEFTLLDLAAKLGAPVVVVTAPVSAPSTTPNSPPARWRRPVWNALVWPSGPGRTFPIWPWKPTAPTCRA